MAAHDVGFFARLGLALRLLFDGDLAARLHGAHVSAAQEPTPAPMRLPSPPEVAAPSASHHAEGALHLLTILQREGRLVDFLQEEASRFSDAEIGAAARVVHAGCRKAMQQYFTLAPVRSEAEGAAITVEAGFDPTSICLTGKVQGQPPYRGRLAHAGWRATTVQLPTRAADHDPHILAPAEVEL